MTVLRTKLGILYRPFHQALLAPNRGCRIGRVDTVDTNGRSFSRLKLRLSANSLVSPICSHTVSRSSASCRTQGVLDPSPTFPSSTFVVADVYRGRRT